MRVLFLTGIAALFLATGTAHAQSLFYAREGDTCLIVKKSPDGFLAVRAKPDVKGELIAVLRPGYQLIASPNKQFSDGDDVHLYENWTKWIQVKGWFESEPSVDPVEGGWVYRKYVKKVRCFAEYRAQ